MPCIRLDVDPLNKYQCGLEDTHCNLGNRGLLMVCLLCRDDRRVAREREVYQGKGPQIVLAFRVHIERAVGRTKSTTT